MKKFSQIIYKNIRGFGAGFIYLFCNYFIAYIPSWIIRRRLYLICGMKIGKSSRIMMRTVVTIPWKIVIGDYTCINEYCYLDGRGFLKIGNNVNIAISSMIITGTHDYNSKNFEFYTEQVQIEDGVWIGARAIVLNGCTIKKNSIISAGSVLKPRTQCNESSIYMGNPAKKVRNRNLNEELSFRKWYIHFR